MEGAGILFPKCMQVTGSKRGVRLSLSFFLLRKSATPRNPSTPFFSFLVAAKTPTCQPHPTTPVRSATAKATPAVTFFPVLLPPGSHFLRCIFPVSSCIYQYPVLDRSRPGLTWLFSLSSCSAQCQRLPRFRRLPAIFCLRLFSDRSSGKLLVLICSECRLLIICLILLPFFLATSSSPGSFLHTVSFRRSPVPPAISTASLLSISVSSLPLAVFFSSDRTIWKLKG